jgi:hypothetical protein
MTLTYGTVESFHEDQLIVALPHLNIPVKDLNDVGARFEAVQRHNVLGLAKVSGLAHLEHAVEPLRQDIAIQTELTAYEKEPAAGIDQSAPLLTGTAVWSGTSFAAAAVSGKLAAHTVPGVRSAREALNDLP